MNATKEAALEALKSCNDPELGIDVVSLGLIYDIVIDEAKAVITMTLTTPGCPLIPYFREEVVRKVKEATGVQDVTIDLTFDPPWDPGKMSDEAKKMLTMMR